MILGPSHAPRSARLMAVFLCLMGAGCQSVQKEHQANRVPQFGNMDASQPAELRRVNLPTYVIDPPDELEIAVRPSVAEWPASTFVVQPDGTVDLGFSGQVHVAGLTLTDAEAKIAAHIDQDSGATGHKASVRLSNGQSKYYYVLGTVNTPGRVKITGNETVLDAITQAGLKTYSLPEKAYLVRPHPLGAPDEVLAIDWAGIKDRGDTLTNYQIMPGDRVVVPGTKPPGLIRSLLGG